ncbi:hypothetical protein JHU38_02690 [Prevotella sp. A2931]|uniref:Uncharacterized protein n=1 Tax=Prevotella illustrans TaxID=2800387 RepID=A0ABS3M3E1_9BACT|nr:MULTISPECIES: hypothetical protein [Prevotella]MBO1362694.1 hypothetical protein [Prevotella illustrans]PTL25548.1 hypothetical protein C3V39_10555 [Prevotella sp. oral taxon 820]
MTYDREIIKVLVEAGEKGLSVKKIAQHVFNASNSLFCVVMYDDIYTYVSQYLLLNSKSKMSLIAHGERRGTYKINTKINEGQQLMIQFGIDEMEESLDITPSDDGELSLF